MQAEEEGDAILYSWCFQATRCSDGALKEVCRAEVSALVQPFCSPSPFPVAWPPRTEGSAPARRREGRG